MANEKPCAITANAIAMRRLHLSVAWRVLRPETETNPTGCFNTLHHLALTRLRFHPPCNQRRCLDALIWLSVGGQSSSGLIGTHKTIQLFILAQMLRRWVESSVPLVRGSNNAQAWRTIMFAGPTCSLQMTLVYSQKISVMTIIAWEFTDNNSCL